MKTRAQSLQVASVREFDVVVIGGGIAGAGVAQDAASRGLSVCLIEKDDFASGTSSRTTKLIHGGLRYLEQFQFKLTRELCQERALLARLAPHLVRDFSFILPLPPDNWLFAIKARAGLTLYDLLSWSVSGIHPHERISQKETLEAAPALSPKAFSYGLRFHDCITDDSRMVLEVIKSACNEGAVAINYLEVTGFETADGRISAVRCHDRYQAGDVTVRCRVCVNATGVWSDEVCKMIDRSWTSHVAPSKGIHIIVPPSSFETNTALFLPTRDRRYVFVVPWQRALMIGTTDRPYSGQLDKPLPDLDEIDYLLSVVNTYTETHRLNRSDIIGSFAGLRPLVMHADFAGSTSDMPREHLVFQGPSGLIGLTGGKLTNYRIMAGQVVDRAAAQLPGVEVKQQRTARLMLGGWADKQDFLASTAAISAKARRLTIEPATLDHLISSYGNDAQVIVDIVEQDAGLNQRICPDFPPIMGEIPFCVIHEMAVSLEDLLMRRLRLGILNQKQCLEAAPRVADLMRILLKWDDARLAAELSAFERCLAEHIDLLRSPVAQPDS
jgi:glycerol-3-phosphate dehydrogenase